MATRIAVVIGANGLNSKKSKETSLHAIHVASGGRMVPFGGWDMPLQYLDGIIAEVNAVRTASGIFDVSHMGRIEFEGSGAEKFLSSIISANVPALKIGRSKYNFICNATGGIIDDAMLYRTGEQHYLLVINAANFDADMNWINTHYYDQSDVNMRVVTDDTVMIAIQGPKAVETVDSLTHGKASKIRRFRIGSAEFNGVTVTLARTGYTGEDGFEIIVPSYKGAELWSKLRESGSVEAGLGARDVLRIEAGLPLHGNDLSTDTNPFEAGLGRFAYFEAPNYIPGYALRHLSATKPSRKLVGFKMIGRGIPRRGLNIFAEGVQPADESKSVGIVTSGTHSPTVDGGIGMGYVDQIYSVIATKLMIDVRGRLVEAQVVDMPFYEST